MQDQCYLLTSCIVLNGLFFINLLGEYGISEIADVLQKLSKDLSGK